MTQKTKTPHQKEYAERNKERISHERKVQYLSKRTHKFENIPIIKEYVTDEILEEGRDWYLKLDPSKLKGYRVELKFKTILYLLLVYKYRKPLFYNEFDIKHTLKRTQYLKEKLIKEYLRIYDRSLKAIPLHPLEYLPRFIEKFNLTDEQHRIATKIIVKTNKHFEFTNPKTYIGSILYIVAKGTVTQDKLAEQLKVSSNGIRGILRKVRIYLKQ